MTNLLRLPAVIDRTGLSKPTIYRMLKAGTFPRPRRINGKTIAWPDSEIEKWIETLPVCEDRHKAA